MKRITKWWLPLGMTLFGACHDGAPTRDSQQARGVELGSCDELGYAGTCVADVSLWHEDGACHVRDCASEGKHCGLISASVGWGCLEGTQGSTTFTCADVGYEGACLSDEVLVWTEGSTCRWADCGASGLQCAWTDSVGYDCVDGGGGEGEAPDFVVAGVKLGPTQAQWVQHIGEEIVPEMVGSRDERLWKAAVVTWWSLKEGVLSLDNPFAYSNCHFPPDQHIGPLQVCPDPNNAWQVGISGVQAAWRSLQDVESLATKVHPDLSTTQVLMDAAATAGFGPGTSTGQSIAGSTGRLRLSWLLRDGAVGFEAEYPVVYQECFVEGLYWCFGTGWHTSAAFAPDLWTSQQVVDDLVALFDQLAP